jgi:hypothetical protein
MLDGAVVGIMGGCRSCHRVKGLAGGVGDQMQMKKSLVGFQQGARNLLSIDCEQ